MESPDHRALEDPKEYILDLSFFREQYGTATRNRALLKARF